MKDEKKLPIPMILYFFFITDHHADPPSHRAHSGIRQFLFSFSVCKDKKMESDDWIYDPSLQ